ncbi:hypothetical protein [Flavobacterium album]|nr:hypothetical protein [Flavobacterium album]
MIFPFDEEYIATKQVMLGKATMNFDFIELADYINEKFCVKPVNIIYDLIDDGATPRLQICLELEKEALLFKDAMLNFDREKQNIVAEKFREMIESGSMRGDNCSSSSYPLDAYSADSLFVYFSAFKPVAQMEFNESVLPQEVAALKQKLGNNVIWEIIPKFTGVTFFVYTDKQVREYEDSAEMQRWAAAYFDILEKYDEFGYFEKESFGVFLDSKENFDKNYDSNWNYYFS